MPSKFFNRKKSKKDSEDISELDQKGNKLALRYLKSHDPADLEQSIIIFERILTSTSPDSPLLLPRLQKLFQMITQRYILLRSIADLDRQFEIQEQIVALIPPGSPELAKELRSLEIVRRELKKRKSGPADLVSDSEKALEKSSPDSPDKPKLFFTLGICLADRHSRDGDPTDLDRAIDAFQQATTLAPPGSPDLPQQLGFLGNALLLRYQRDLVPDDLDSSLESLQRATEFTHLSASDQPQLTSENKLSWLNNLGIARILSYELNNDYKDIEQAVAAFDRAVNLAPANSPHKAESLTNLEKANKLRKLHRVKPTEKVSKGIPAIKPWREVRVFISSTFRDMHAERDHLVRFVFPRLRDVLQKRRLHLIDVDLRWGVTSDEDAFERCMDEIERCLPRFVCMLGGRYGWVPLPNKLPQVFIQNVLDGESPAGELTEEKKLLLSELFTLDEEDGFYYLNEKPPDASQAESWQQMTNNAADLLLSAGLEDLKSITSSEIFYGALDRLDNPTFSYFYFRDPDATALVPSRYASDYYEPSGSAAEKALSALKKQIKGSTGVVTVATGAEIERQLTVHDYDCKWDNDTNNFIDLTSFGNSVYSDLLESVDAEFGTEIIEGTDPYEDERFAAEAFIETRLGTYQAAGDESFRECYLVGSNEPLFEALRNHAAGTDGNGTLCIVGQAGSGKSALLAKFYRQYMGGNEEQSLPAHNLTIPHFVGVNATHPRDILYRLCYELAVGAKITAEIPFDFEGLSKTFPLFLKQAAKANHILLLIDGVDQIDLESALSPLAWLPDSLPKGARVILTAAHGKALDGLRKRHSPPEEVNLKPMIGSDIEKVIDRYLTRYRKAFEKDQLNALLAKKEISNPLFIVTALEELRTLGTYELTPRIEEMPGELRALFIWILKRLEQDPNFRDENNQPVGQEIVERFCSFLSIARNGLSYAELAQLVSPPSELSTSQADSQGNVAALQLLLRPYLMQRGEQLDLSHLYFHDAIQAKYFQKESVRKNAHQTLARYFRNIADPVGDGTWGGTERGLGELPYHLTKAGVWDELCEVLTDFRFLESKATSGFSIHTGISSKQTKTYSGVFQLQNDFTLALTSLPQKATHQKAVIEAFANALRLESHILSQNPGIIWQQIYNRLQFDPDPIKQIVETELTRRRESGETMLLRVRAFHDSITLLQTLKGHVSSVRSCDISTDGTFIASGSLDKTIKLWDIASGQERITMRGHTDAISDCKISLDDTFVVSAGADNTVRIWDTQTGTERAKLMGHTSHVNGCAISPDNTFIVSASWDKTLKIWDAETGMERATLKGHDDGIMACSISPDNAFILSASQDGTLKIWDSSTGKEKKTLTGHTADPLGWVSGCVISPDLTFFVSSGWDGTLKIWDSETGKVRFTLKGHNGPVNGCALSPDGSLIVSCGRDGNCKVWDVESGAEVTTLTGHSDSVNSCVINSDGSLIISASQDGTLKVWRMAR